MNLQLLHCGHCLVPRVIIRNGNPWERETFPAMVALIVHPQHGPILFDTGYSQPFFEETKSFPEKLYALTTPVKLAKYQTAAEQLKLQGIDPTDVKHIILSHFHADHTAGIKDFPKATIHHHEEALAPYLVQCRFNQVRGGFLSKLLPNDLGQRSRIIETSDFSPATSPLGKGFRSFDLFDDGSLHLVPLPGHAHGHCGLLLNLPDQPVFLLADACWYLDEITQRTRIRPIAKSALSDKRSYETTLEKLRTLHQEQPNLPLIPCHEPNSKERWPHLFSKP